MMNPASGGRRGCLSLAALGGGEASLAPAIGKLVECILQHLVHRLLPALQHVDDRVAVGAAADLGREAEGRVWLCQDGLPGARD